MAQNRLTERFCRVFFLSFSFSLTTATVERSIMSIMSGEERKKQANGDDRWLICGASYHVNFSRKEERETSDDVGVNHPRPYHQAVAHSMLIWKSSSAFSPTRDSHEIHRIPMEIDCNRLRKSLFMRKTMTLVKQFYVEHYPCLVGDLECCVWCDRLCECQAVHVQSLAAATSRSLQFF